MVDTDTYMPWLLGEVRSAGCRIIEQKVTGPLAPQAETLLRKHEVDAIVNCRAGGRVSSPVSRCIPFEVP